MAWPAASWPSRDVWFQLGYNERVFDTLLASYDEALFWLFPVGASVVSMTAFVLFALPLTLVAHRDPASLRRYRIQPRRKSSQPIVWRSIRLWLLNNAIMTVMVVISWPLLLRHCGVHAGPLPAWWVIVLQLAVFIYLDDFLYYWMHRAMHWGPLYKRIHSLHHRIAAPWACAAHYMHPVEYVLTASLMLLGPIVLGSHVVVVYAWVVIRQFEAAEGHCGYDFPWSPSRLLPGSDGAAHHDFHHRKFKGNYAGFLPLADRLFNTLAAGYSDYLERRA